MHPVYPTLDQLRRMPAQELAYFRAMVEHNFPLFVSYVFFLRRNAHYVWSPLHVAVAYTLREVDRGTITRLIINAPPRMGKSEAVTVYWPAWHFCKNPRCNFIEVSYSKDLIYNMSSDIREVLQLPEIRYLFGGVDLRKDTDAKGLWRTEAGGGMKAAPSKGQITGFGAGILASEVFGGAIVISDPVKPADANSMPLMETVNNTFNTTTRNRVNDEQRTPIVVEMQRIADNDLSGFLLGGGSGERWYHLRIPPLIDEDDQDDARRRYETDWNHGIPIELDLEPGYIWPEKYGAKRDKELMVTPDIRNAQYMQNPRLVEGAFFSAGWFRRYDAVDVDTNFHGTVLRDGETVKITRMSIYADTAQKTSEVNDWSVFQLWGLGEDLNIYLIDQIRGKWEAPDLETEALMFMRRYADRMPRRYGWREICIEDKASGTGLIQQLRRNPAFGGRVKPIGRSIDKVSRAYDAVNPIHHGRVWIPKTAKWVNGYLDEFTRFSKYMTHKHDDQMDPTFDAIGDMLAVGRSIFDVVR